MSAAQCGPCGRDRSRARWRRFRPPPPSSSSRRPASRPATSIDKAGILDPDIMCPRIAERPNDQISILAEMAVTAARDALKAADRNAVRHRRRAGGLLQHAARLSGDGRRGAGRARHRRLRLRHERGVFVGHLRLAGRRRHGRGRPRARDLGVQSGNLLGPSQFPRPRQPFHLRRRRHRLRRRARRDRARANAWEIVSHQARRPNSPTTSATISASSIAPHPKASASRTSCSSRKAARSSRKSCRWWPS